MPTTKTPTKQSYPKRHLFAASGMTALLCLALLVYPSREVEAKKTFINIELEEQTTEQVTSNRSDNDIFLSEADYAALNTTLAQPEPTVFEYKKTLTVKSGDTLSILFNKAGLGSSLLHSILATNKDAKRFTHLKADQKITFELDENNILQTLSSQVSPLETIYLEKQADTNDYTFRKEVATTHITEKYAQGTINGALFSATKKAGLPYAVALDMAKIFGYDIDFAQDIRSGDTFELIYEEKTLDGKAIGVGNILSARFTNRGKVHTAVRYTDKNGNSSYYAADGSSLRKAFIRTPAHASPMAANILF